MVGSPEDYAAEDDFFEVDGNTLAAMRLVVLLEGAVSLRDMMQYFLLGESIEIAARKALEMAPQPEDNLFILINYQPTRCVSVLFKGM